MSHRKETCVPYSLSPHPQDLKEMKAPCHQLPTTCRDSRLETEDKRFLIPHPGTCKPGDASAAHQAEKPPEDEGIKHRPDPVKRTRHDGHQDGHQRAVGPVPRLLCDLKDPRDRVERYGHQVHG